jgi:26S proteasome regulatory subunit N10
MVSIPPGPHLLSDMLISSPILAGDHGMGIPDEAMGDAGIGAGPSGAAGGSGAGFEFGVDPSLDPELAMVRLMYFQCVWDLYL